MRNDYGEEFISRTASAVGEAIDLAAVGTSPWDDVARLLAQAFPGSFAALQNIDPIDRTLHVGAIHGIDPDFQESYYAHYITVNPWIDYLKRNESGRVSIAELECPARLFAHTEFYNDWLLPQKDVEGAVGLQIDVGPRDFIHFPVHYPLWLASIYDAPAAEVLRRIRGNLQRAVDLGSTLRGCIEGAASAAAILERSRDMAFVVDSAMRLREANGNAVGAFDRADLVRCVGGTVSMSQVPANLWLAQAVRNLLRHPYSDDWTYLFTEKGCHYRLSVIRLAPSCPSFASLLVTPRDLAMVILRKLGCERRRQDLSFLAREFALTPSELRLCEILGEGVSLADAAGRLGIANQTARDRLKTVFHKTGTHRQAELVAMIARYDLFTN